MEEERRKREEEEGHYEVQRILEVKFKKNGDREFMIRWKGNHNKILSLSFLLLRRRINMNKFLKSISINVLNLYFKTSINVLLL